MREMIPAELNDTALELPAVAGMVPLFEAWAAKAPERVAVVDGALTLSYGELNGAANRLARRLVEAGAGPGSVVALYAGRSAGALTAMLAVLKAGAAYLPLDPGYPAARVELVLRDSGAGTVLVPAELRERLPEFDGTVLELSGDSSLSEDNPDIAVDPTDPAYILYTSGSTGRPKGVVIPHRALLNFLVAMEELLEAGQDDVWLALTSLSFDISGLELYLPLVTGARAVIADPGTARDGHRLAGLIRREGVTHVQATPSGWRVLLAADYAGPAVTALVGGEALSEPLADELRARVGRLFNVYGPTETTIWSTAWEVRPGRVSIGRPIGNTRVHVVDERMEPATTGELLIGGLGLANGYHLRAGLTGERFVPDPFGPPGGRLYRTGDVVRLEPDGTLRYLGRTDNQVKLRGHRIELGEIESVLEAHPGVRQAVVAVRRETLVAYLAGDGSGLPGWVAERLPSYMVPSVFVPLETLPLTPNGKVDRNALPEPGLPESGAGGAARTEAERVVAEVFAEVLGLDAAGTGDDFFLLGGHSLLAARAAARVARQLGVEVPVAVLFAHSTVAAFAAAVQELETPSAPPRPRPEGVAPPLSPAQERMWFLYRLDPADASYNVYLARRLRGALEPDRLVAALGAVVARHETLRTRFPEVDGVPVAVVEPDATVVVERVDLTELPAGEREAEARRRVNARVNAPFDLVAAPPVRATLVRLAADEHVLCVVFHHIVGDGWSQNVLLGDLAACYEGAGLPELVVQHGDVTRWRQEREAAGARDAALAYWRERLAGVPALELPADRPRPGERRGAVHRARVPHEVVGVLEELGRTTGTTLFMVLLAAYQALLARQSGQADLAVGTAVAGRDRVELEPLIGFLAETLVLRGDLSGDPAFTDLLVRTRRTVLDAFTHGDVPMERMGGGTGLFQTMLILHTQDDGAATTLGDATAEVFHADYAPARFDVTLDAWLDAGGLELAFGYEASLFDPATIERLAARFGDLLRNVAASPGARLSSLARVTGAEREGLLHGPNDTALELPAVAGMVPLFEAWAAKAPERVAVVDGALTLSYGELNGAANRLARRLVEAGAGPGSVVALYAGRSAGALTAMLAVLKAGAAYLPLDPDYPAARIELVLRDSGAGTVLVPAELRERLPEFDGTVLTLDDDFSAYDASNLDIAADQAYVLYTSGSTGRPKGVVVPHRALLNFLVAMEELLGAGPDDVWLAVTSLSFDISGLELYLPLITGARTVIAGSALDGALLGEQIRREGVTHVQATPSGWRVLLAGGCAGPAITALVGGEALSEPLADELRTSVGRLFNVYGPTETTIWSTAWEVKPGRVSIGRPIGNTRVYVLDEHLEPVPAGAPGELLIGGLGLANGYHQRPALTAERFVPDPFGPPGGRLYRTGDVVRLGADGTLQYLGRTDNQVKLRGHRIELGEIESALETHPGVRQAVAAVHRERLVAYLTGGPDPAALRAHLAERLPAYMIPSVFVPLETLPLTPNGKVDRKALPVPGAAEEVPLRPREPDAAVPLSPAQERLWFLDTLGGDPGAHLSVALRLRGPLNDEALVAALAGVAARHEGLRTRFPGAEGRPLLVVEPEFTPPLARHDLTRVPDAEREARRLVAAFTAEPFDLGAAPPVRVALVRLAAWEHVLCVAAHPIVADAWSLGVLLSDLAILYERREPPPPPVQAGDVTLWRGGREAPAEAGLEHWCGRLAGSPVLDLPLDRPRPGLPARTGGRHELRLDPELGERLERLGREAGGTSRTVLLAAYQVALARHTGQIGFMIGLPVAGREVAGLEGVFGHLTRHLVVRGELPGDPAFTELLRLTRAAEREAAEHAGLSPERLLSALEVERDPGQEPLFQTTLTVHEDVPMPGAFGGLEHEPFMPDPVDTVYDLALEARGLELAFQYDASLLDAGTVGRFAGRFTALLERVAAKPERNVSELVDEAADGPVVDPWGSPVSPGSAGVIRGTGERGLLRPDGRVEPLPAPGTVGRARTGSRAGYVAPRTDAEALVADVWSDLLGVSRVGAADDFFHLGGHSLLAVRAAARLRATIDVDVPIRTFFSHRTVEEFAGAVEEILLADLEGLSDEEAQLLLDATEVP
ncbi:amino acid adenylation domain-containing protein [Nonomuraea solani]|uniref:Amino acid adenylation domain-containing protein n=1 Tax=Nonomuraea solani TaxID=1144553 RepID=A0A1H6EVM1_9ACTN|nr:non-ribosomal peptide synthetase [Nonomuraea solani]SEH00744.1 amino acid adenylation domain-containing protein [Nonomuraea solani]